MNKNILICMLSNNDVYVLLIVNIKTPNISLKNMSIFIDRINSPEMRPSGFINCQSWIDRKHILVVQKSTLVFFAVDVSILNLWPINTDVEMMGIAPVNWYKTRLLLRFDTQVIFYTFSYSFKYLLPISSLAHHHIPHLPDRWTVFWNGETSFSFLTPGYPIVF